MADGLSRLHRSIVEHYDLEELRTLCFGLGVNYDDLRGEGLSAKARELILRLGRRRQLDALLATLQQSRPKSLDRAGLGTDAATLDALYAELPAFEASAGSVWASLGSRAWSLVTRHWPVLLAVLVADGTLVFLYRSVRDRYLVGSSIGMGAVILATLAILGWYVLLGRRWRRAWLWAVTLGASLLLVGGLAWQARRILRPAQFPPQVFGIAVARFGEGESFRVTSLSRNVTDQIMRGLRDTIQGNPDWDEVHVMPVGLVANGDQAQEWGKRVRADLVVWGQVVAIGQGTVSVHFEIIQTFDLASSPIYPMVLPAQIAFASSRAEVVETPLQAPDIKQLVSQQSQIITAFSLGLAAYFNRDYAAAVEQFQTAAEAIETSAKGDLSEDEKLGLAYFYLGRSYQLLGELEIGEDWLRQAADYRPEDPATQLSIAYGYNSMERKDEAQRLARKVLELATDWLRLYPDDVAVAYDRGLAYQLLDEPRRAAGEFDAVLDQEPTFYVAYLSAGLAYLEAGDVDQAIERFQTAIQQSERSGTDSSWGYFYLAEAYNEAGEVEQAETFYQHAVDLAPNVDWMHYRQGQFYESQDQIDAAQQAYERMVKVTYNKAWAHAEMAKFLWRQSRREEAIEAFEDVRRERIYDTLSQIYLAELYLETGQPELARKTYNEALERTPDLAYGHASYGKALAGWSDYEAAISHYKTALESNPSDDLTRFNMGRVYDLSGQFQEAVEAYQAVLDLPSEPYSDEMQQWAQERIDVLILLLTATPTPTMTPTLPPSPTPTWTPTTTPTPLPTPASPSPLTPTPTPSETPTPTPTPVPTAVQPELVEPLLGREYQNPLTFKWNGSLGAGQAYQVTAYHPKSDYTVQSELLMTRSWSMHLSAERYGEWRWWVTVVRDGVVAVTSPEWMFWFNPFPGGRKPSPLPTMVPCPSAASRNTSSTSASARRHAFAASCADSSGSTPIDKRMRKQVNGCWKGKCRGFCGNVAHFTLAALCTPVPLQGSSKRATIVLICTSIVVGV